MNYDFSPMINMRGCRIHLSGKHSVNPVAVHILSYWQTDGSNWREVFWFLGNASSTSSRCSASWRSRSGTFPRGAWERGGQEANASNFTGFTECLPCPEICASLELLSEEQ